MVSVEIMGMKVPVPGGQQMTITFDSGKAIMTDGNRREETTYKLDNSRTPHGIDLSSPKGQPNQVMQGICKIEGDTLKIGFPANGPGNARPTRSFDGKALGVMVFKAQTVKVFAGGRFTFRET